MDDWRIITQQKYIVSREPALLFGCICVYVDIVVLRKGYMQGTDFRAGGAVEVI